MKTVIYVLFVVLFCMLASSCSSHRYVQFDTKNARKNTIHNTKLSAKGIPVKVKM